MLLEQPSREAFMRLSKRIVLIALAFVFMGTALAHAQKKLTNTLVITRPSEHLVVLSTAVDRANQTLTIQGLGFGAQPPQVWCETYLMTVMSATDSQLVVFLPGPLVGASGKLQPPPRQ